MSTVSLTNAGLIPIEAVTTMGISAKEGENPIGFFGTGLKYAVASLLRLSHRITIWRGLDRYDFTTETGEVRGKEFGFIFMTGPEGRERLGFTTHLGSKWEVWQVFRELYSNCLDEGGSLAFAVVEPQEGHTTIHVTGEAFAEAARKKGAYFLTTSPIYSGSLVDIHPGRTCGLYYRGVLVGQHQHHACFTYNIKAAVDLTEDRTLKSRWIADSFISHALANCDDRAIIEKILVDTEGYEAGLSLSEPCAVFAETTLEVCERRGVGAVIRGAVASAEAWAQREARVKELALNERERREVEDAKAFLARIGYPITAPVIFAETLGPDVFGMAKHERIYIARVALNRGGNFLIGTLLEEQLHISHGFLDESRRFQDFLIDLVVKFAKDADLDVGPPPVPPTLALPSPADEVEEAPAPAMALVDEMPF